MENLRTIVVDLNKRAYQTRDLDPDWVRWGGRAFTSRSLYEQKVFDCDPFSGENILVIATGLMAGSGASSSYRISIGAKSPLTGGIKEANSGGLASYAMSTLGIRAMTVRGISPEWVYVLVSEDGLQILSAGTLVGKDIFETTAILQSLYSEKAAILSIGPAGERLYKSACIGITDIDGVPARHAARGGLGSVMGAKQLKAIVFCPARAKNNIAKNPQELKEANKRFAAALINHPTTSKYLPQFGTAIIVDSMQALGGLPTHNYSLGSFEQADRMNAEALYNLIVERGGKPTHACMPGCVVRCSNVIPAANGEELNRALEYETMVLLGSNCGISDLDTICKLNRLCDSLGIDTIETGAAIGVAMEAGLLPFGDAEGALELMNEIARGTETGKMIAEGADETGRTLGITRVPTVRGQAMAAYDPRTIKGTGVTYASSPMGADHTAGNVLPGTKLPNGLALECNLPNHQVELSRYVQLFATMFDYLGLCWFTKPPIFDDFSLVLDVLNAMYAEPWDQEDLFRISRKVLDMELEFNRLAGLDARNDVPAFFRSEPLLPNNNVFDVDEEELQKIHQINDF
ncbi:aldehyde ferredoxin oxidoreductase C-terminal domain-containing protein [Pelolinea submarina]|uniref:Aldehyde:ferredoxin oxidoreductase n=1 Tax=Pelolinea submarina TaxID=913107 RepID=A0A347ZUN9_9CHLR|nr:aldehyde ferredoxin oxidoreductase C-terminal domain-containing protein [Pelolinea submarina]REG10394.1 aldehyde:ferredoxin oxidoreductase [Pelolinea submarina]BBB49020.1 aldehyde:ferredoxin oxidoreductase [Pelolinea submarina]